MRPIATLLFVLLGACHGGPQARTCAPFDKVDTAKLTSRWENFDGDDVAILWSQWLAVMNEEMADAPLSSASLSLSIAPYPSAGGPREFDIRGARIDGVWRMTARTRTVLHSGGEETGHWRDFALTDGDAAELDGILDDDCFWNSPRFLASQVPMRSGRVQTYYHAPLTFFEVRQAGREWGGVHELMAGAPGRLVDLLVIAAYPNLGTRGGVVEEFDEQTGDGGVAGPT